jgi:hypothetical protein
MPADTLSTGDGSHASGSVRFSDERSVTWSLKVIEFWFNAG